MAVVQYIATHSIAPGHVSGDTYNLHIKAKELQKTFGIEREDVQSIAGARESIIKHRWREWNVKTIPMNATDANLLLEFLDSTLSGVNFIFDPVSNDVGNFAISIAGAIDSKSVQQSSVSGSALFSFSFTIRDFDTV